LSGTDDERCEEQQGRGGSSSHRGGIVPEAHRVSTLFEAFLQRITLSLLAIQCGHTRPVDTPIAMRRVLTLCAFVLVGLPAGIHAATAASAADGTLAIKNATGTILIKADAVVIGHGDKIRLTITDEDPTDGRRIVLGYDKKTVLGPGKTLYTGEDVRFKLLGGDNTIFIRGSGISLSAVGEGKVSLDGGPVVNDGKYSIDDGPFKSLPDSYQTLSFGS
jgi:hypothetical protein